MFFENGKVKIADACLFVVKILPCAENIRPAVLFRALGFQYIGIVAVNRAEFVRRVHIEQEQPAGIKVVVHGSETGGKVAVAEKIVQAVQTADNRADRSVQFERAHILLQKQHV